MDIKTLIKVCSKINDTWQFFGHNFLSFQPFSKLFFCFLEEKKRYLYMSKKKIIEYVFNEKKEDEKMQLPQF